MENNIGYLCTEAQCLAGNSDDPAITFINSAWDTTIYTYRDMNNFSNRFANILHNLGILKSEVIFTLMPKTIEQFYSVLGALKAQVIVCPLFSNLGDEAIMDRLEDSHASLIITNKTGYKKIKRIASDISFLKYCLIIDCDTHVDSKVLSLSLLMKEIDDKFQIEPHSCDIPSILHYTSGSTGKPKGVLHTHKSILLQRDTAAKILMLKPGENYWCTADQGWVTGISYGIIGPMSLGVNQIQYAGGYNYQNWLKILADHKVKTWYTAPTALRMLMRDVTTKNTQLINHKLKGIYSVGEPLNPEVIKWANSFFGIDVYDTWFQTETGSIIIANTPKYEIKPGSMGKPFNGISVAILDDNGDLQPAGSVGNLCVKKGWDSMFIKYINKDDTYKKCFINDYYKTGDTAYMDKDDYVWFQGRNDDIINTGGHLVSPFEVESVLLEMPQIDESGVIGIHDDVLYEKVIAYITLKPDVDFNDELILKIRLFVSRRLSSHASPHEIILIDSIPKNKSGKIMRRVLKAKFNNTDAGDISTMEDLR